MLNLAEKKEQIFLHDPGKLEKKLTRFSKDDFDFSIHINFSLRGIISSVDIAKMLIGCWENKELKGYILEEREAILRRLGLLSS